MHRSAVSSAPVREGRIERFPSVRTVPAAAADHLALDAVDLGEPSGAKCILVAIVDVPANVTERAIQKLQRNETIYNVAAVFVGETTARDLDGSSWRLYVTDGITEGVLVEALVARVRDMDVDPAKIERAVERRAGHLPIESRLQDLAALRWVQIDYEDTVPDKPVTVA
jgi:hypothetical protein